MNQVLVDAGDRFIENSARVEALISLYETSWHTGKQGRRPINAADVLRAATVLLHATLEDLIRTLCVSRLPAASAEILNGVPLDGLAGRAERFQLGALASHRGRTVDDLIRSSVEKYLERSNYGNTNELVASLRAIGVEPDKVDIWQSDIAALMERRHQIVHRADRNPMKGKGQHSASSISPADVRRWLGAVRGLASAVLRELAKNDVTVDIA